MKVCVGKCVCHTIALSSLSPNFTSDKYHPLCGKQLDIEGKQAKGVAQQNQMFSAISDLEGKYIQVFPIVFCLLKEESGNMRKLTFILHAEEKGEIDTLVWGQVFCCVLKGLCHHSWRQEWDSDKNNPFYGGRGWLCWYVFLYVCERFLCMTEEKSRLLI